MWIIIELIRCLCSFMYVFFSAGYPGDLGFCSGSFSTVVILSFFMPFSCCCCHDLLQEYGCKSV